MCSYYKEYSLYAPLNKQVKVGYILCVNSPFSWNAFVYVEIQYDIFDC